MTSPDPYRQFLGLSPGDCPPGPRDLLGLTAGKLTEQTIHDAAASRMNQVRPYAASPSKETATAATRILNEVAAAVVALLHERKSDPDELWFEADADGAAAPSHEQQRVLMASIDLTQVDLSVLSTVPKEFVRDHKILPFAIDSTAVTVAAEDPDDFELQQKLEFVLGRPVRLMAAAREQIVDAIVVHYNRGVWGEPAAADGEAGSQAASQDGGTEGDPRRGDSEESTEAPRDFSLRANLFAIFDGLWTFWEEFWGETAAKQIFLFLMTAILAGLAYWLVSGWTP